MSTHNPYAPPQSEVRDPEQRDDSGELAPLKLRLIGAIVDGIVSIALTVPMALYTGYFRAVFTGDLSFWLIFVITGSSFALFAAANGYLLATSAQTIGKRVVGTRIVNVADDGKPTLKKLLGVRYGAMWLVSVIPIAGDLFGLVDTLFIFRGDRRCVHDHLAGTKVVIA